MKKGIWSGVAAYAMWGLFPIYWKMLHVVPALQVIGHRIGWSCLWLTAYLMLTGQWKQFRTVAFTGKSIATYSIAAVLLTFNWLTYVWGVNAGFIVETSLGYFINPLLSVLLGVLFLKEKLRRFQWVAVTIATIGVGYLTLVYGRLPWIALVLAFTFGFYGFAKKLSPLGSLFGLTLETGIVFPVAVVYLSFMDVNGSGAFMHEGPLIDVLLIGAGVVTTIPLLLFASSAKQVPLSIVGLLQYIAPTIQFLIGVFVYGEEFDQAHFIGFSIVWAALILFAIESYHHHRAPAQPIGELGEG
ncbi:MAG: EamA family transporter RarD [Bacteroidetes bacterium]|nr:EamA family transporter RarD [Bacteroidota bacterium]